MCNEPVIYRKQKQTGMFVKVNPGLRDFMHDTGMLRGYEIHKCKGDSNNAKRQKTNTQTTGEGLA